MLVTVFADASFGSSDNTGGWGAWCRSQRGRAYHGGALTNHVSRPHIAEYCAALMGIILAYETEICRPGDHILLQSDCMTIRRHLNHDKINQKNADVKRLLEQDPWVMDILDPVHQLLVEHKISVQFRHVKAHQANDNSRSFVNNLCDRIAKDGRRKAMAYLATTDPQRRVKLPIHYRPRPTVTLSSVLPADVEETKLIDFSRDPYETGPLL